MSLPGHQQQVVVVMGVQEGVAFGFANPSFVPLSSYA